LILDEISNKKDISFDKGTLEHHGIVDFGDGMDTNKETDIADHVLVFMFRPYRAKWVQPFACFASKGAASGTVLFELITKAIVALLNHCAIVKEVVIDGAKTNKKAYNLFGIDGTREWQKYFIQHPLVPDENIIFSLMFLISSSVWEITHGRTNLLR
jgi:hypothetical protein